jgi:hypothetical protein
MSSFLDKTVFIHSLTDMDENARWTDNQVKGKYPISAIQYSRIADRQVLKKKKVDTATENEMHSNESEDEGRDNVDEIE